VASTKQEVVMFKCYRCGEDCDTDKDWTAEDRDTEAKNLWGFDDPQQAIEQNKADALQGHQKTNYRHYLPLIGPENP
ncbi:hypothetical protein LCGC14_2341790, partial [marine sediment metagenome]